LFADNEYIGKNSASFSGFFYSKLLQAIFYPVDGW